MSKGILPAIFALFLLFAFGGCAVIPQTDKAPYDIETPTGTIGAGEIGYTNKDGELTPNPVDPDTGEPNKKFSFDDEKKVKELAEKGKGAASNLPGPFGVIGGAAATVLATFGLGYIRRRNEKKIVAAGGKKKT